MSISIPSIGNSINMYKNVALIVTIAIKKTLKQKKMEQRNGLRC